MAGFRPVQLAKSYILIKHIRSRDNFAIARMPGTAITAHSKPSVPPVSRGAASAAVSMRTRWNECTRISTPNPTKKPCASGRSGWNPCLLRAKTGMVCGAFACGGSGVSTVRRSCVQRDKISSACSNIEAGDGVLTQQKPFLPSFGCILVVDSSFFGRVDLFLSIELRLLNPHEGRRFQILMSFERAFFTRLFYCTNHLHHSKVISNRSVTRVVYPRFNKQKENT